MSIFPFIDKLEIFHNNRLEKPVTADLFSIQSPIEQTQNIGNNSPSCALTNQSLSIQDDATGSFLMLDKGTGAYTFTRCSDGFTISGVGVVKVDGCAISLEDTQADHRVVASINECAQEAKAIVEKFPPASISPNNPVKSARSGDVAPFQILLIDQNISNNLMNCAPVK